MVIGGVLGIATAVAIVAYLLQSQAGQQRTLTIVICLSWVVFGGVVLIIPRPAAGGLAPA